MMKHRRKHEAEGACTCDTDFFAFLFLRTSSCFQNNLANRSLHITSSPLMEMSSNTTNSINIETITPGKSLKFG